MIITNVPSNSSHLSWKFSALSPWSVALYINLYPTLKFLRESISSFTNPRAIKSRSSTFVIILLLNFWFLVFTFSNSLFCFVSFSFLVSDLFILLLLLVLFVSFTKLFFNFCSRIKLLDSLSSKVSIIIVLLTFFPFLIEFSRFSHSEKTLNRSFDFLRNLSFLPKFFFHFSKLFTFSFNSSTTVFNSL